VERSAEPGHDVAAADLLGVMACGELLAFERLAHDATLAPTLDDKAELARIRSKEAPRHEFREIGGTPLHLLLTNRTLLANYWAYFVYGYFLFFFMTWLPSYLEQAYGLKLSAVGWFTVLPWLAAAVGLWSIWRLSDYLLLRTGRLRIARSYLIAATQFVAAFAVIPVALTHDLATAIACIVIAVAASMGGNAVYFAVNVDVAPGRSASAFGIMNLAFAISGFLAPVITGAVLKLQGNFAGAFWLMAVLGFLSVLVVLCLHDPDRDRLEPA